jgi:hypothetical protein
MVNAHTVSNGALMITSCLERNGGFRVVVQSHLQGRSMRETAEALGISLSAAKGRLFHAKKALRRSLFRPGLRIQVHDRALAVPGNRVTGPKL